VAREEAAAQETLDPGEDLDRDLENLDRGLESLDQDLESLDQDPGEEKDPDQDPFPAAPQHKSRR
jgi:hypothetical protein